MSQLSSALKRYTESARYADAPYAKSGYGTYTPSSYGANLAASFLAKEKLGFKPSPPPSVLARPRTHGAPSALDYDRGRPLLRADLVGGGKRAESQPRAGERPSGSGLSGGGALPYGAAGSALSYLPAHARDQGPGATQRKANSHLDLARDFSGLRTSESYRTDPGHLGRSPMLARTRKELCALQGLYQAASRPDYLADYLENYGRKGSAPQVLAQAPASRVPEVLSPTYRPSGRYAPWEKGQVLGPSRSSSPGRDTMVSVGLGAPVTGWGGSHCGRRARLREGPPPPAGLMTEGLTRPPLQPLRGRAGRSPRRARCPRGPCSAQRLPTLPRTPTAGPVPSTTVQQCSWKR